MMSLIELKSDSGVSAEICTVGASLVSFQTPDRDGKLESICLSLPDPAMYRENKCFIGCSVGRYSNRIGNGTVTIDGVVYRLDRNEGTNTLHGGSDHFGIREWEVVSQSATAVKLKLVSPDGDQGFPGEVSVTCEYSLSGSDLTLKYEAESDRPTIVNLTHHAYWNLSGVPGATILDHILQVPSEAVTLVDANLIPTGEFYPAVSNCFDFQEPRLLGDDEFEGLDVNYVVQSERGTVSRVATLVHPNSGRVLETWSDEVGLQVYTGQYLAGEPFAPFPKFGGICLEPQAFPNACNVRQFGPRVITPSSPYQHTILWRTSVTGSGS